MIWILLLLWACYVVLIISLTIGFKNIPAFTHNDLDAITKFSIIIPFRNEANNLPTLLKSIGELEYLRDSFEIIFVDDNSNDNSKKLITEALDKVPSLKHGNIRIINNNRTTRSPKKDAITTALNQTKNNWIITTDADCQLPKKWLITLDAFIQKNKPNMIVGGVNYKANNSFLANFQLLDFMSLQGSTIGGFGLKNPFLCNGANLAYRKDLFIKLNGFEGNNHIASGDDVFLFEKFLRHEKKTVMLLKANNAIVTTFPVKNWIGLFNQRVRWASKTSQTTSFFAKLIGLVVFGVNLSLILTLFFAFFYTKYLNYLLFLFVIKVISDLFLFLPTVTFYKQKQRFFRHYIFSSFLYPFFSVFVVLYALLFKFTWKGRSFKK